MVKYVGGRGSGSVVCNVPVLRCDIPVVSCSQCTIGDKDMPS
jgi:hypothetical protein